MIDCSKEINTYHNDKIALPEKEQSKMRERRNSNRDRLKNGLDKNDDPKPKGCWSQGSYIMRTMVQDPKNDYDIDDGVYFNKDKLLEENGSERNAESCREMVCNAIKSDNKANFKNDPEIKNNCVRIHYAEGYHIDIPVYRITEDEDSDDELFELASGNEWVESDARALNDWFKNKLGELKAGEIDHSQMRRVVKFSKKFARSRTEDDDENWKEKMTSGICITKLVADNFSDAEGRDDESIFDTWNKILEALEKTLRVEHPLDANKTLSNGDNDEEVKFFKEKISWALDVLNKVHSEEYEKKEALSAWDEVFNTCFFSDQLPPEDDSDDGKKKASTFYSNVKDATKRDDRGGRYG